MSVATVQGEEWMTLKHAARLLGVAKNTLRKIAPGLGIRCLVIPGKVGGKYNRDDILRAKERIERNAAEVVAAAQQQTKRPGPQGPRPAKNETARPP